MAKRRPRKLILSIFSFWPRIWPKVIPEAQAQIGPWNCFKAKQYERKRFKATQYERNCWKCAKAKQYEKKRPKAAQYERNCFKAKQYGTFFPPEPKGGPGLRKNTYETTHLCILNVFYHAFAHLAGQGFSREGG